MDLVSRMVDEKPSKIKKKREKKIKKMIQKFRNGEHSSLTVVR